jgi:RNA-binding protein YhbY
MMSEIVFFQLGKAGLTNTFVESLSKTFKKRELVKISILKSCCRDRKEAKELAEKLCQELEKIDKKKFTFRLVGYTLFVRKWRRKTL